MRHRGFAAALACTLLLPLAGAPAGAAGSADSPGSEAAADEATAVRQVVTDAYVDGIHNFRDPVAIRAGFHPDFEMLVLKDGQLEKLPLAAWIERIEAQNAKEPPPSRAAGVRSTTAAFPLVDLAGSAAICKVELSRGGRLVFTDYLALYRFADGWRIVGKSFYRHP